MNLNDYSLFYKNVILKSKHYNSNNPVYDINLLYPPFKELLLKSIKEFSAKFPNVKISIGETYRSKALQNYYFNTGASKTKGGTHGLGLAVDVDVSSKYYPALRSIFKNNGLYLLGSWDLRHVQFIPVAMQGEVWKAVNNIDSFKPVKDGLQTVKKQEAGFNPVIILIIAGVLITVILKKGLK